MKPILFSTPMVQAIMDGRKTMTRRVIKPQPVKEGAFWKLGNAGWGADSVTPIYGHSLYNRMPYKPGDVLWVKETWGIGTRSDPSQGWVDGIEFKADEAYLGEHDDLQLYHTRNEKLFELYANDERRGWHPSIFMPREAARLFLRVNMVRAERIQDISRADAIDEGFVNDGDWGAEVPFEDTWNELNAKRGYGWDSNPFCWVVSFERIERPSV